MIRITPLKDQDIQDSIVNTVSKNLPGSKIIFFGSRANGVYRDNSDYDIAIDYGGKISAKIFFDIKEILDRLPTLKTIDLIDFHNLDQDFKEAVIKQGKIIYDGSAGNTN